MIFTSCIIFTTISAQNTEEITRRVADQIIKNTSFKFINKKTGEKYASAKEIPSSQRVSVESPENEWYYMNGVINIGMMQFAELTGDKKYSDYSLRNFDFIFSNLNYFEKQYDENVTDSPFYQYFRLGKLDDCGAMYDRPTELNDLHRLGAVILAGKEMIKAEKK